MARCNGGKIGGIIGIVIWFYFLYRDTNKFLINPAVLLLRKSRPAILEFLMAVDLPTGNVPRHQTPITAQATEYF